MGNIKILSKIKHNYSLLICKIMCEINPVQRSQYLYEKTFGKKIDLKNPKGFNEKIQWIKLNKIDGTIIRAADKYEMHRYITELGYPELLCKLYGVYDRVDSINFETLPGKFVLKATHGCGYNIICHDKST
ncbi:MAG: ATP-grasp fold amidoligase family protein, partial [Culicoidibacterales bacterium]